MKMMLASHGLSGLVLGQNFSQPQIEAPRSQERGGNLGQANRRLVKRQAGEGSNYSLKGRLIFGYVACLQHFPWVLGMPGPPRGS